MILNILNILIIKLLVKETLCWKNKETSGSRYFNDKDKIKWKQNILAK